LDVDSNLDRFRIEARRAVAGGADLLLFPELFLTGYRRKVAPDRARDAFRELSSEFPHVLFVFGSLSENRRNRVTVWSGGAVLASYDKVHLFHPNDEHQMWEPGDRYVAFRWQGRTFGILNCNDLRFPEQARALRLRARAEVLLIPAWWPWRRDHVWRTLLRARAIENAVWVLGCCIQASAVPEEEFAGAGNYVFDPVGTAIATQDDVFFDLPIESPPPLVVDPLDTRSGVTRVEIFGERQET
jgi:predicted amidohydrolase